MVNFNDICQIYVYIFEVKGYIISDRKNNLIYNDITDNNIIVYEIHQKVSIDGLIDIRSFGCNSYTKYNFTIINNDKIGILTYKPINDEIIYEILNLKGQSIKFSCNVYNVKDIIVKFKDNDTIIYEYPLILFNFESKGYIDYSLPYYPSLSYIPNSVLNHLNIPSGTKYYIYFGFFCIWSSPFYDC
jgi:hypothetical protein